MPKQEIKIGFTNKKYRKDNEFVLIKSQNGFNHKIDYQQLASLDFVPKLIRETNKELVWEFIEGKMLKKPTNADLKQLGQIIGKLHKSNLKFPENNLRKRVKKYLDIIHDKTKSTPELVKNYSEATSLLLQKDHFSPCHNDLWWENILKDQNGKLWIVDWEYATMGNKHFDLAYFIESLELNSKQRKIFLNEYSAASQELIFNKKALQKYERFVNYLTMCWALSQDQLPFSLKKIRARLK